MLTDVLSKTSALHQGLTLYPGALVFDSVSHEFGRVESGSVALVSKTVEPPAPAPGAPKIFTVPEVVLVENWAVRLTDGSMVRRDRDELQVFDETSDYILEATHGG